ncbi:MAG TPA: tetratricopeptide repeat protein [Pirellulales bacterium]|nr:tetratricopeptide repeat protein [Pirellulales bacterium]
MRSENGDGGGGAGKATMPVSRSQSTVSRNRGSELSRKTSSLAKRRSRVSVKAKRARTSREVGTASFRELEKKYSAADKALRGRKPTQAVRLLQQLVRTEPREPLFHWRLGSALSELKQYTRAISQFKQALDLDPQNIAALGLLGRAYIEVGEWQRAEEAIQARLALQKSPHYYVFLAHVMIETRRYAAAMEYCRQAIELDPSFSEAFLNLGLTYRHEKRLEDAVAAFQKAIELDAKYAAAFRELGLTYYDLAKFGLAEAALRHCLSLNRHDGWGHLYLALSLQQTGDFTRAARHFEKARKNDPKNQFIKKKHDEFQRLRSKAGKTKPARGTRDANTP